MLVLIAQDKELFPPDIYSYLDACVINSPGNNSTAVQIFFYLSCCMWMHRLLRSLVSDDKVVRRTRKDNMWIQSDYKCDVICSFILYDSVGLSDFSETTGSILLLL